MRKTLAIPLVVSALTLFVVGAAPAVSIDLVTVGNPGKAPDTRYDGVSVGSVPYTYQIGKFEITNAQWREFLTAKASVSDPYGLYDAGMSGAYGGIDRTWSVDHYVYTAKGGDANWDNRPVNWVSFWDAARFCNWLQNGQGNGDTETGAYINFGSLSTFARQSGAMYVIPTENEWYKAAYYDPGKPGGAGYWDYATRSDAPPINTLLTPDPGNHANFRDFFHTGNSTYTIGSPYYSTIVGAFANSASPYGTFDQGGNMAEWNETAINWWWRGLRGGSWRDNSSILRAEGGGGGDAGYNFNFVGFRVAFVPEPSGMTLLAVGAVLLLLWSLRRHV